MTFDQHIDCNGLKIHETDHWHLIEFAKSAETDSGRSIAEFNSRLDLMFDLNSSYIGWKAYRERLSEYLMVAGYTRMGVYLKTKRDIGTPHGRNAKLIDLAAAIEHAMPQCRVEDDFIAALFDFHGVIADEEKQQAAYELLRSHGHHIAARGLANGSLPSVHEDRP